MGLNRDDFDDLKVSFDRHYVVLSGLGRPGHLTRLVEKRMMLYLIHHMYASKSDLNTLCELFGCPPSTTAGTIRTAESALELALANMQDAAIRWPSAEEQHNWSACVQPREPIITKSSGSSTGKLQGGTTD